MPTTIEQLRAQSTSWDQASARPRPGLSFGAEVYHDQANIPPIYNENTGRGHDGAPKCHPSAANASIAPVLSELAPNLQRDHRSVNPSILHKCLTHSKDKTLENREQLKASASENRDRLKASEIQWLPGHHPAQPGIYTQRHQAAATPGPTQDPRLSLSHPCWQLQPRLIINFAAMGIVNVYPWQAACLLGKGILHSANLKQRHKEHLDESRVQKNLRNLVYTAPTGGGKSLVADLMLLKRVLSEGRRAVLVLPYVALVQERTRWLRRVLEGLLISSSRTGNTIADANPIEHAIDAAVMPREVRVVPFHSGSRSRLAWEDADIVVCTIEKANSLINAAIESSSTDDLGIVVMDELHMVDDPHRGYLLELLATKLLCLDRNIQLVGMSATLSNTEDLARWLHAKYYRSSYKPVPIEEYLVCDHRVHPAPTQIADIAGDAKLAPPGNAAHSKRKGELLCDHEDGSATAATLSQSDSKARPCRVIAASQHPELSGSTTNAVVALAIETACSGFGALVFCSSRNGCQKTAMLIARAMPLSSELEADLFASRLEVLDRLRSVMPVQLDETLEKTVLRGVAFHHAGLTSEERDIVADAYDRGILHVMVATCSLAAGINLPARRVVLHGARMGRDLVGPAMLRQMRGRAGRRGKDELGESYVCCNNTELEEVESLLRAEMPPITSCLSPDKRGLKRALLEAIAIRLVVHRDTSHDFTRRTLLQHTVEKALLEDLTHSALAELISDQLLVLSHEDDCYEATLIGQATVAAGLAPDEGLFLHAELQRALQTFHMDTSLQALYLFTPLTVANMVTIDWHVFREELGRLDEAELRVVKTCGINPALVNRMANGSSSTLVDAQSLPIYTRLFTTLALSALCTSEQPLSTLSARFALSRGTIQTLANTAHAFAASTVAFCRRLDWGLLAAALAHAQDRLHAGVGRDEFLGLTRLPFVQGRTARVLWEHGLRSLRMVADARLEDVQAILELAQFGGSGRRSSRRHLERNRKVDQGGLESDEHSHAQWEAQWLQREMHDRAAKIIRAAQRLWAQECAVGDEE